MEKPSLPTVEKIRVGGSVEQAFIAMLMGAVREEKNKAFDIELISNWFPLTDLKTLTVLGSFAWTSKAAGKKWILRPHAHHTGWGWCSPADIARDYISVKYKDRRMRITTEQYRSCVELKRSPPLVAVPQVLPHAFYIDLTSAYWSILRVVGWDVDYNPDRWLMVQSDVDDFPYPHIKLARNSLVSSGIATDIRIWTGEKLVFKKTFNHFINNVLWACVQDVLNCIARDVLPFAAYINTDGYIVRAEYKDIVMDAIARWGLPCSIKYEGRAEIYNVGEYNIEGKNYVEPRTKKRVATVKIHHPDVAWLRKRFSIFAEKKQI